MTTAPSGSAATAGKAVIATVRPAPTGMSLITPDALVPEIVRSLEIGVGMPLPLTVATTRSTSADVSGNPMATPPVPSLQVVHGPCGRSLLQGSIDRHSNPAIEARFMGDPGGWKGTNVGYQPVA